MVGTWSVPYNLKTTYHLDLDQERGRRGMGTKTKMGPGVLIDSPAKLGTREIVY